MNPPKIILYINPRLLLSIIFDKNNIETAPIPPIMIATVYSTVETLTTLVAYLGKLELVCYSLVIISRNKTRWRFVTSTICLSCSGTGLVL